MVPSFKRFINPNVQRVAVGHLCARQVCGLRVSYCLCPMTPTTKVADNDLYDKSESSWWNWLKWVPTSHAKLAQSEDKILQRCTCYLQKFFLPIYESSLYLRTIVASKYPLSRPSTASVQDYENRVPLVLVHGFASGVGLWCKNLDSLSGSRRVYAFDLLGFGRSSRPPFPNTAEEVENKYVEVIEEWRKNMKLEKFILLGHSMGGFLVTSYALSHPERVTHLILIDPWGFVGQDESNITLPTGIRGWAFRRLSSFRALTTIRIMGPFGFNVMRNFRQDFEHVYSQTPTSASEKSNPGSTSLDSLCEGPWSAENNSFVKPEVGSSKNAFDSLSPYDPDVIYNYIYHINVRQPTGEDAFRSMSRMLGWAARPMLLRIQQLSGSVPITFIYGGRSWVDMSSGLRARALRPNSYVKVMIIEGGGHHAYAQYSEDFNNYVNEIAHLVDQGHVFQPGSEVAVQEAVTSSPTSSVADDENNVSF